MVLGDVNKLSFKQLVDGVVNDDTPKNEEMPERMERGTIIEFESNKYNMLGL